MESSAGISAEQFRKIKAEMMRDNVGWFDGQGEPLRKALNDFVTSLLSESRVDATEAMRRECQRLRERFIAQAQNEENDKDYRIAFKQAASDIEYLTKWPLPPAEESFLRRVVEVGQTRVIKAIADFESSLDDGDVLDWDNLQTTVADVTDYESIIAEASKP